MCCIIFFFNDTATTEIYTLSLHDALPIFPNGYHINSNRPTNKFMIPTAVRVTAPRGVRVGPVRYPRANVRTFSFARSEEHTSELQSRQYLVCRLLLEKKKKNITTTSKYS